MKLDNVRMLVTLANDDRYMINENTEDLYDIVDNHLIMHDIERTGKFIFKKWREVAVDLGEIASAESKGKKII